MDNEIIGKFFEKNPGVQKSFEEFAKAYNAKKENKTLYKWVCESDDGYFEDSSIDHHQTFESQEEAYIDMRDAALAKMTWNTDWNDVREDCEVREENGLVVTDGDMRLPKKDNWGISYNVCFHPQMIQHASYSGLYTYRIVKIECGK